MRASRLLQTAIACAWLAIGSAYAHESVTVNYSALDQLPAKSSVQGLVAPRLIPPSLALHRAVPQRAMSMVSNEPLSISTAVPPIFEPSNVLYNHFESDGEASSQAAFGGAQRPPAVAPNAVGITGASTPVNVVATGAAAQETAMLTSPVFTPMATPAPHEENSEIDAWRTATRVGEVLFKSDGYEVLDLDRNALYELDRLARSIGGGQQRILLRAFGGHMGDDSHEAHRMALRRGLAVRRYLIARGVPSERIDVVAVGGATDGGPLDRVDVVAANG